MNGLRLFVFMLSSIFFWPSVLQGQTLHWKTDGTTGTWTSTNWGNAVAGPFTSGWTASSDAQFNANSLITYVTNTAIGNITVVDGITVTVTQAGTLSTGGNIRTFDVGTGSTLTWVTQNFSTVAGTGFIKNGNGTWDMGAQGNMYVGGFTLNAGTIIISGNNTFGSGPLAINGGIIQSTGTRNFAGSSMSIGGDFTFTGSGNATFPMAVSLGTASRMITNNITAGNRNFSGVISGSVGSGLTFTGSGVGPTYLSNAANTFSGPIVITGGDVGFPSDGSFGASTSITLDGGRLTASTVTGASSTYTLSSTRNLFIGSTTGTAINVGATGILTYNGIIADVPSTTGNLTKQGSGTLVLGGASTYSGSTNIQQSTVRLTGGVDRLPVSTTVNLGQAGAANVGTLDLNGFNQTIAGLNSIAGTNVSPNKNTVTSTTPAILTVDTSTTNFFGDGSSANSGVITGSISLVKNGPGRLTLEDSNNYTGTTTVNAGALIVNGPNTGGSTYTVNAGGTLGGIGAIVAPVNINGGTLAPGNSPGMLTINGALSFTSSSTFAVELNGTIAGSLGYDQLTVGNTGSIALNNANLFATLGFAPSVNDIFFIIQNLPGAPFTTFFNNLPEGAPISIDGYSGNITYLANFSTGLLNGGFDVAIYNLSASIPEPGSIALMALAGFGVVQWYLRKQKKQSVSCSEEQPTQPSEAIPAATPESVTAS